MCHNIREICQGSVNGAPFCQFRVMICSDMLYHQPEYKPSTPSQNQTGGTNHGSNGLRDEYDNPEDLYEDNPDWFEDEDEAWDEWEDG